ncbi:endonuclease [Streptomyces sp. HNM0574]|uniref:endonuclease n=1 Tax=Streptomyces sp. HNM0574 TaxID=2714954 RepID=UPI00146F473C|nr:endonuclease [Streptomyces sp. HNM0574]NLU68296.1 endonuclease I [Streptomyces sp. HNM0574]
MVITHDRSPTSFLGQLEQATERYAERTGARERTRRILDEHGVLYADAPDRVTKRLARLGTDWNLATALSRTPREATTGRGLGELTPESFGADLLGLERLMGRNDLIDVGFLEAGFAATRSVGRIVVRGSSAHYGTGFLVSPSLMLTNNHVLSGEEEAARSVIEFNYQDGLDGSALIPAAFPLEPARFFVTDPALDFTFVAVAGRGTSGEELAPFGWLRLNEAQGKVILGELVNIIQHPNGEPKQLALRENHVVDLLEQFLHYATDTAPGSSGSPVFNDQWEVVALHHAGVPLRDAEGRLLAVDGSLWSPENGEDTLAWKANEGVRISRVLRALREAPLSGAAAELRTALFGTTDGTGGTRQPGAPTDPVVVTAPAGPGDGQQPAPSPVAGADFSAGESVTPGPVDGAESPEQEELRAALAGLEAGRARPYYEAAADQIAREVYYADVVGLPDAELGRALTALLERTHERRPAYRPVRLLYPWVDLHPDLQLRGAYSGLTFAPEEFIRADVAVEAARSRYRQELSARETVLGPDAVAAELEAMENSLVFNCEHVVPQSWFGKREPMRGDLHHLFACETGCNSFRGNIPYFDFTDFGEVVRTSCGRRESQGFEPAAGKGPAARATLYFLLRYPGLVGDETRELRRERLEMLLSWHESEPVGAYEQHRNAAIAEIQGNRNPLIDRPDWARRIDFAHVWP